MEGGGPWVGRTGVCITVKKGQNYLVLNKKVIPTVAFWRSTVAKCKGTVARWRKAKKVQK